MELKWTKNEKPFCWTKIQAEGGQPLEEIIRRKEFERLAGHGVFYWGIGNSLGKNVGAMYSGQVGEINFSKMSSQAKKIDHSPTHVSIWQRGQDMLGVIHEIPEHVAIVSRSFTPSGRLKDVHYALVCYTRQPLKLTDCGIIDVSAYKNLGSNNTKIGASQVTTIIEHNHEDHHRQGRLYKINMKAESRAPHFLKLLDPLVLSSAEVRSAFSQSTLDDYLDAVRSLRRHH